MTTPTADPRRADVPSVPPAPTFDEIYERHAGLLRALARTKFHVPLADVEPLVQDAFVAYLTDPTAVHDVRAYLVGVICNRCRTYWTRHHREREVLHNAIPQTVFDDRGLQELSDRLTLEATLARLSPRCRDLLTRYYLDHETIESLAAVLETSAAYVHKLLHGCRKHAIAMFQRLSGASA